MHLLASETIKVQHLFTFFILLLFGTASADYFNHRCLNTTNYTSGSPYQTNRNQLLSFLVSNGSINGFYNDSAGDFPNTVYGRALCRGNLSASNCSSCLTGASTQILQRCPNSKDAIIWFDECHLVYYSKKFVFNISKVIRSGGYNENNVSDPVSFNEMLGQNMRILIGRAAAATYMWSTGVVTFTNTPTFYGMAQCCRDLSISECSACLDKAVAWGQAFGLNSRGVRVLYDSCIVRYEVYPFFQDSSPTLPPSVTPSQNTGKRNKRAHTILIIIGSVGSVLVTVLLGFMAHYFWMRKKGANGPPTGATYSHVLQGKDGKSQDLPLIDLATLQASTDNFSDSNKLGQGGFGPVYKGKLPDGKEIAVKRLSRGSGQGLEELMNEIILIAKLQHKNLVRLMGCCLEKDEKMLIYEYMPNKSLDFLLFDSIKVINLDWKRRFNIIAGIARGLLYLHEDSRLKVIHRDLKASNVLLDLDMNPKISDFGMARIFGVNQDEANTNKVVGTYGYMAPEYAMDGLFSIKSDVFSFGVLLLEIVSGKRNTGFYLSEKAQSLLAYAWQLWIEGRGMELMDPLLGQSCPVSDVLRYIQIGLLCVQEDPALRPAMSKVVLMLGSDSISLPKPMQPAFSLKRTTINSSCGCSANEVTLSVMDPR